ncbi:MAG TPA: hypothetical protein DGH68_10470 [Bacteroidetes bacterium]|nr:hypothetical protein [Bacteroidota bacterium]
MIEKVDISREAVKKTGKAFLIAGSVLGTVLFLSHSHLSGWLGWDWQQGLESSAWKWFIGVGAGLFGLSHIAYPVMKPIHFAWMRFSQVLAWISTRVILSIFFYLVITPMGLLMRLLGKDLLDKKIDRSAKSYWKKRDLSKYDPKHAARTF